MLRIRFQRTGTKNTPTYRLVVCDKRRAAKGKSIENLGVYLPARKPAVLEVKQERIQHWISQGAQPTDTVARVLMKLAGFKKLESFTQRYTKQKSKNPEDVPAPVPQKAEVKPEAKPEPIDEGDKAEVAA